MFTGADESVLLRKDDSTVMDCCCYVICMHFVRLRLRAHLIVDSRN